MLDNLPPINPKYVYPFPTTMLGDYYLPSWLFYKPKANSSDISPAAPFDVAQALATGNAWRSSTSPATELQKAPLILDKSILSNEITEAHWLALIHWFQMKGFCLYLCVQQNGRNEIISCQKNTAGVKPDVIDLLDHLRSFDSEMDYERAAKHDLERAQTIILDADKMKQLATCLWSFQRHASSVTDPRTGSERTRVCDISPFAELYPFLIFSELHARPTDRFRKKTLKFLPSFEVKNLIYSIDSEKDALELMDDFPGFRTQIARLALQRLGINGITKFQLLIALSDVLAVTDIANRAWEKLSESLEDCELFLFHYPGLEKVFPKIVHFHWDIKFLLKNFPHRADEIIQKRIMGFHDFAEIIKYFPERADELIVAYSNVVREGYAAQGVYWLRPLVKACHRQKRQLSDIAGMLIKSAWDLNYFLQCQPPNWQAVVDRFNPRDLSGYIRELVRDNPEYANYLLAKCRDYLQTERLHTARSKIELAYLRDELGIEIQDENDLFVCMEYFPEQFDTLLRNYGHLIIRGKFLFLPDVEPELNDRLCQTRSAVEIDKNYLNLRYIKLSPALARTILKLCQNFSFDTWKAILDKKALPSQSLIDRTARVLLSTVRSQPEPEKAEKMFLNASSLENKDLFPQPFGILATKPSENTDCVYLYLGEAILSVIDLQYYPNLVVLEITGFTASNDEVEEFFRQLRTHCKQLRQLILPESLRHLNYRLPYRISYQSDIHTNDINNWLCDRFKKPDLYQNAIDAANFSDITTIQTEIQNHTPGIFVANNGLSADVGEQSDAITHFKMAHVGELLNGRGQKPHAIRTGIIEFSDDFSKRHFVTPKLIPVQAPRELTAALIQECREQQDCYFYYKMHVKLAAGQTARLLSVYAHEDLFAASVSSSCGLDYSRGEEDDFFYVTATCETEFTYILKAPTPDELAHRYQEIPTNNPIKQIIEAYLTSPQFQPESRTGLAKQPQESYKEWFLRLYAGGQGSCFERCGGVLCYVTDGLRKQIRIARIENNHTKIEFFHQGECHQVELGGSSNYQLEYDNSKIYSAPAVNFNSPLQGEQSQNTATIIHSLPAANENNNSLQQSDHQDKELPTLPFLSKEGSEAISNILALANSIKTITEKEVLATDAFNREFPHTLIITQHVMPCVYYLLQEGNRREIPIFYLHGSTQVAVGKKQPHLSPSEVKISAADALDLFIKRYGDHPHACIIVNGDNFTPQERLAANTLIEPRQSRDGKSFKSIYGKPFNGRVISLVSEKPTDISFLNRHQQKLHAVCYFGNNIANGVELDQEIIDLRGFPDWQAELFGKIILSGDLTFWQHSKFVELLGVKERNRELSITIRNVPEAAYQAFSEMLAIAKARGYFEYHHHRININKAVVFNFERAPFDFTHSAPVAVAQDISPLLLPSDYKHVNTVLFDYLLQAKDIHNKYYYPKVGWLAQYSGRKLNLFVTSKLSDNQWYCLFAEAERLKVNLQLYLASGVTLPSRAKTVQIDPSPVNTDRLLTPCLYISRDPEETLKQQKLSTDDCLAFAVEDYSYQDLIALIDFQFKDDHFCDFSVKTSKLYQALMDGKKIILYGEFSKALLAALEPLLLQQVLGPKPWPGQLTLIVDAKCNPNTHFLPQAACCVDDVPVPKTKVAPVLYRETLDTTVDLTDSERRADEFLATRLNAVCAASFQFPIIQLIGHTGVGKTFLMKALKEFAPEHIEVYYELDQLVACAKDKSTKIKFLFLDEVNISDKHLTLFKQLINDDDPSGKPKTVFYDDNLIEWPENCYLVCARNQNQGYGGGRVQQKLFASGQVPELQLEEMPADFVYERMLKPMYSSIMHAEPDDGFKRICEKELTKYFAAKRDPESKDCIRELQEQVLQHLFTNFVNAIQHTQGFFASKPALPTLSSPQPFIVTPAIKPIYRELKTLLNIRKQQHLSGEFVHGGLNGCLIEGRPGMGKTELSFYTFNRLGYQPVNEQDIREHKVFPPGFLGYIKMDASLPLEKMIPILEYAFDNGFMVWIDEINSCLKDGLEKWLNAFMSGYHPITKKAATHPGFAMMLTANSIGMEGRGLIGRAIRGRVKQLAMPEVITKADVDVIVQSRDLDDETTEAITRDLHAYCQQNPSISYRELMPKLPEIVDALCQFNVSQPIMLQM